MPQLELEIFFDCFVMGIFVFITLITLFSEIVLPGVIEKILICRNAKERIQLLLFMWHGLSVYSNPHLFITSGFLVTVLPEAIFKEFLQDIIIVLNLVAVLGLTGIVAFRRNLLFFLVYLEMLVVFLNIMILLISQFFADLLGFVALILMLCVSASEASLLLAVFMCLYNFWGNLSINSSLLKSV